MRLDENIFTFLYFLSFFFFFLVHLSIIFHLILKKIKIKFRDILAVCQATTMLRGSCFFSELCIELFTQVLLIKTHNF